jgi:hypothetical protein
MRWENGYSEASVLAQIQLAAIEKVADLISEYKKNLKVNVGHFSPSIVNDSSDVEQAVFNRSNPYLNVLLADSLTDQSVTRNLWAWSYTTAELTKEQKTTLRKSILSGTTARDVIEEYGFNQRKVEHSISLLKLLGEDKYPDELYLILKNPHLRHLAKELLEKKDAFQDLDDEKVLFALCIFSENPSFNLDKSDSEDPDLTHWSIENATFKILEQAPVDEETFKLVESIVENMDQNIFYNFEFPVADFCEKWKALSLKKGYGDDKDSEQEGFYTSLTKVEEFVCTFAAKFGRTLIRDKKVSLEEALNGTDHVLTAAYFGNSDEIDAKKFTKVIESLKSTAIHWLAYNATVLRYEENRSRLEEIFRGGYSEHLFNANIKSLAKTRFGLYTDTDTSDQNDENQSIEALYDRLEELSNKTRKLSEALVKLEGTTKNLLYLAIFIAVVLVFK